jgi:hypothetical protein
MSDETRKILDMLAEGKISVDEAEKLIAALNSGATGQGRPQAAAPAAGKSRYKYLRVMVEPGPDSENHEKVNIRVPLNLIRAGLKWAAFIPRDARTKVNSALQEKGIDMDFDRITSKDLEELIVHLNDLTVEVDGKETIRVYCE